MNLNEFLNGSTIIDFNVVRGLGIVPARIEIEISKNNIKYVIEAEENFRFISNGKMLLCFNDMLLDGKYNEISIRKFRSQKNIENTLLFVELNKNLKKIIGKKIKKVTFKTFGDVSIYLSNKTFLNFVHDTNWVDSTVFRIRSSDFNIERVSEKGKVYMMPTIYFELRNNKGSLDEYNILGNISNHH